MNKKRGYVRLWRSVQDCEIWETDEKFDRRSAWIDLILMASHKDSSFIANGAPVTIKRGQIYTSVRKLSERWHWDKGKTLRFLRLLEQMQMIRRDATPIRTLLTIVKYDDFQGLRDSDTDSDGDSDTDSNPPHTKNVRSNVRKNVENKAARGVELE